MTSETGRYTSEQLRSMADSLREWKPSEEMIRVALVQAASTEDKVQALVEALQKIVDNYKQSFHTDWTTAANYADVSREALSKFRGGDDGH